MSIWNRFFAKTTKQLKLGLADSSHPARQYIKEAAIIADQSINVVVSGDTTGMQADNVSAVRLVSAIEQAIEESPDDLDLLVAKSGALCCAAQFKTAEQVIDEVLSINPEHFEARMRKDHWEKWQFVFQCPPWSLKEATLHPVMAEHLQHAHQVQIIRDGLQIGIAVVKPAQSNNFPSGLSNTMRSKWEPMWYDTPFGPIVAHYFLVEDNPSDPYKDEGILPTFIPGEVTSASGYWLLQRMSQINSCFLILSDGDRVLYNARYVFPKALKKTLSSISQKVVQLGAKQDVQAFQKAIQWYMQNVDINSVRIHF